MGKNEELEKTANAIQQIITDEDAVPTRNYTKEETTGYSEEVTVAIDPKTGEHTIVNEDLITDELEDVVANMSEEDLKINLDDSTIEKNLTDKNINAEEMLSMISLIKEYKENDGNIGNVYSKLPKSIQAEINSTILQYASVGQDTRKVRNMMAKEMIESIISESEYDQITIDLDNQLNSVIKEYSKELSDYYKDSLFEKINSLEKICEDLEKSEDEEERNKAREIGGIIDALKESYELTDFIEGVKRIKIKKFDLEKPEKLFGDMVFKYKNSKFTLTDPKSIVPVISKHADCTLDEALELALVFCKYCANYSATNVAQHTFMYYFITNIISLNITSPDKVYDDFSQKIVDKLKECIEIRREKRK